MDELTIEEDDLSCEVTGMNDDISYQSKISNLNSASKVNAFVMDHGSDENVPNLHSGDEYNCWNRSEHHNTDDTNHKQGDNKPSVLFLKANIHTSIKSRSNSKNNVYKNKNSTAKDVTLSNKEVPLTVKEVNIDEDNRIDSNGTVVNGGLGKYRNRADCNNNNNNNTESIYSDCLGTDKLCLGPNDSFATIKSVSSDDSEPVIVIVRNVDSDEPTCEPVPVSSSRNVNTKILVKMQVKKRNNLASKGTFPKIHLTNTVMCQCVLCGLECLNRTSMIEHVKLHSSDKKSFECPACKKIFTQQCNLRRHMRRHSGERPFGCPYCRKRFADQGYLTTHIRYHTNTKPYTCQQCSKSFFDRSNYIKHLKYHSGEKPYPCAICKKSFLQQSDLTRHVRIHSGEKPFKCNYCERSFTQHGDLTTHQRRHTGERPFACSNCQKTFANKRYLNSHVKELVCLKKKANIRLKEIMTESTQIATNYETKKT